MLKLVVHALCLVPVIASAATFDELVLLENFGGSNYRAIDISEDGVVGLSGVTIVRYTLDGQFQWRVTLDFRDIPAKYQIAPGIVEVQSNSIYVIGSLYDAESTASENDESGTFVQTYDFDGQLVSTQIDTGLRLNVENSQSDADGVYILGSYDITRFSEVVMRKYTLDGRVAWTRSLDEYRGNANFVVNAGRLYVVDSDDFFIYTTSGQFINEQPAAAYGRPTGIASDGANVYVAGVDSFAGPPLLKKFDLDGIEQWAIPLSDQQSDFSGLAATSRGVYLLNAPIPMGSVVGYERTQLLKFSPDGALGHWDADIPADFIEAVGNDLYLLGSFPSLPHMPAGTYLLPYADPDFIEATFATVRRGTKGLSSTVAVFSRTEGDRRNVVRTFDVPAGILLTEFAFPEHYQPIFVAGTPDINGNGSRDLITISYKPDIVEVRDGLGGDTLALIELKDIARPSMAQVARTSDSVGEYELALLMRFLNRPTVSVDIHTMPDGKLKNRFYSNKNYTPAGIFSVPDLDGDDFVDWAILTNPKESGRSRVEFRGSSGTFKSNMWLGEDVSLVDAVPFTDPAGNSSAAVLRLGNATAKTEVVTLNIATRRVTSTISYSANYAPIDLFMTEDVDFSGYPEFSVFGHDSAMNRSKSEMRDMFTGAVVSNAWLSRNLNPRTGDVVGALAGYSNDAFALLGTHRATDVVRIVFFDALTGQRVLALQPFRKAGP